MKQNFKTYLQFGLFLFGISAMIYSCQKDDDLSKTELIEEATIEGSNIKTILGKQIPETITNYLKDKTDNTLQFNIANKKIKPLSANQALTRGANLEIGTVDTSKSVMVVNETNTKYTFGMVNSDVTTKHNLVVIDLGTDIVNYYISYKPEASWLITHDITKDMRFFTGDIIFYNTDGVESGVLKITDGTLNQNTSSMLNDPCDEVIEEEEEEEDIINNDNGTTGGSGDSGSGTSGSNPNNGGGDDANTELPFDTVCEYTISQECSGVLNHTSPNAPGCTENDGWTVTFTVLCSNLFTRTAGDPISDCVGDVGVLIDSNEDCDTSKEDLKKIFPNISDSDASTLASVINDKGKDFGINSDEELWHFLSQAGHETGGFNTLNVTESTYWTTASKLATTYSKFTTDSTAASTDTNLYYANDYLQNSSGVANIAMCCKYGNGNVASGDGYKYRGRGLFQLTWKDNYTAFKTWYNNKYDPDIDVVTSPELLATNDTLSILSGLWYYKTKVVDAITIDSTTTVDKVTLKINGKAKKGIDDRKARFKKAKDSINCL